MIRLLPKDETSIGLTKKMLTLKVETSIGLTEKNKVIARMRHLSEKKKCMQR